MSIEPENSIQICAWLFELLGRVICKWTCVVVKPSLMSVS